MTKMLGTNAVAFTDSKLTLLINFKFFRRIIPDFKRMKSFICGTYKRMYHVLGIKKIALMTSGTRSQRVNSCI